MRALVTGGNGFIGSFLAESLLEKGFEVRCLVRETSNLRWLEHKPVHLAYGDLSNRDSLEKAVHAVDYVFHLAGRTKTRLPQEYFEANTDGTENLLKACESTCPKLSKFIFVSSLAAAGPCSSRTALTEDADPHPITPYGASKLAAENIVGKFGALFPVTIVRPPAVYGPRDTDVFELFKTVKLGLNPKLTGGDRYTNFIHVFDLVRALICVAENPRSAGELYFATGDGQFAWGDVVNTIAQAMHRHPIQITIPAFVLNVIARFNELFARLTGKIATVNRYKVLEMKQHYWLCDNAKIRRELGFKPNISLEDGTHQTLEWYRQQRWL
ncbi:NAD-dependent epimerase/dehydratase family protein [candidate division KSB1 bacterium]|nr:NAD-dependent epimerase/dehydratase family protein [candidate division KSB1 bacterium]